MLDAVANTLTNNASIKRVVVRAFAADADPSVQAQLAQGRAQLIVDELIARGIDAARLTAEGVAQPPAGQPSSPLFLIVERAP
jgi:outer membrane protein OmpA-like peptidoglycan-associated protein